MCRGKQRSDWFHTADLKATLLEIHRNRKKRSKPFTAAEFNPFREPPEPLSDEDKAKMQAARVAFIESLVKKK
jgi:hypothetical protein